MTKPFKIKVTPEQSIIVQEYIFKHNYAWADKSAEVLNTTSPFLFFTDFTIEKYTTSYHVNIPEYKIDYCLTLSYDINYFNSTSIPELKFNKLLQIIRKEKLKIIKQNTL